MSKGHLKILVWKGYIFNFCEFSNSYLNRSLYEQRRQQSDKLGIPWVWEITDENNVSFITINQYNEKRNAARNANIFM